MITVVFRLGTRIGLLGGLVLAGLWMVATLYWIRQAQARLAERPRAEEKALRDIVEAHLSAELAAPPPEVRWSARVGRSAVEAWTPQPGRRGRRDERPDLRAAVSNQLEASGLETAWIRELDGRLSWTHRGEPVGGLGAEAIDGPQCLARVPGRAKALARCAEVAVRAVGGGEGEPARFFAGGLRLPAITGPAGLWALYLVDGGPTPFAVSSDWPGHAVPHEWIDLASGGERAGGVYRMDVVRAVTVERSRELPVVLVTAVAAAHRLEWRELVRGEAGPLTAAWREWLAQTGFAAAMGFSFVLFVALRLNRALAPLLSAARRLADGDRPGPLPMDRSDELGVLSGVLAEQATSLEATRKAWERAARVAAWRDIARGVAHEIKNPLTPIRTTVENLLRWRREDRERFEELCESRLGSVLREVDNLGRIAGTFSDLARLAEPRREPGDLNALVRDVATLHAGGHPEVAIEEGFAPGLPTTSFDTGQMRQVAANLVKNAIEAMGSDGGTLFLATGSVPLATGPDGVFFEVGDTGPGADEATRTRMFNPGFTTKGARGGSGFGLFLCRRAVVDHGGRIEALPRAGGGLAIRVTLPSEDGHSVDVPATAR